MENGFLDFSNLAFDLDLLVNRRGIPIRAASIKKTNLPVRKPSTVPNPSTEMKRQPSQTKGSRFRILFQYQLYGLLRLGTESFVGVQTQNPIVRRQFNGPPLLGTKSKKILNDDSGAMRLSDFTRVVDASAIQYDFFGREWN